MKINRLSEDDFTKIIKQAGGSRYSQDDSRERNLNADYIFDDAIVELKFVEEEGVEKEARQLKLSKLFLKYEESPVIVLDPLILSQKDQKQYFNIMEGPIKTHVKKASKQLKATNTELGKSLRKILIIVNNGYSSLDQDEFSQVVTKCVKNDTTNIDFVISCGIYYYSDGYDSYFLGPFELCKIDDFNVPHEFESIRNSWNIFLDQYMTRFITEPDREVNARLPVLDLEFQVNGRTYIKPTPQFGKKSEFYVTGRPRVNSTGIEISPIVAKTFPKLSRQVWELVRSTISDSWKLQESYEEWTCHYMNEEENYINELQPLVPINVELDNSSLDCFSDLCAIANDQFNELAKKIILSARKIDDTKVEVTRYIYLVIQVIGRDKKNDLASIYIASGTEQPVITDVIVENQQVFFEWGVSLASAYAIKNGIDVVLYSKNTKYAWI